MKMIKLKLRKVNQESHRYKHLNVAKIFVLELRNRFSALDETTEMYPDFNTKKTYVDTSIKILDYRKWKHKEWLTKDVCQNA